MNEETRQTFKLISDDGEMLQYEGGYWMTCKDFRLTELYPGKFIVDYDKETKQITLTYNPWHEKSK